MNVASVLGNIALKVPKAFTGQTLLIYRRTKSRPHERNSAFLLGFALYLAQVRKFQQSAECTKMHHTAGWGRGFDRHLMHLVIHWFLLPLTRYLAMTHIGGAHP